MTVQLSKTIDVMRHVVSKPFQADHPSFLLTLGNFGGILLAHVTVRARYCRNSATTPMRHKLCCCQLIFSKHVSNSWTEQDEFECYNPEYAGTGTPKKRRKQNGSSRERTTIHEPPASASDESPVHDVSQKRTSRGLDDQFQTDASRCIICQQEKRDRAKRDTKGHHCLEKLTNCINLGDTLCNTAMLCDDQCVLLYLVSVDAVAAEVMYHRSCYQCYTNRKDLERLMDTEKEKSGPYDIAFTNLLQEVQDPICRGKRLFTMPVLCDHFNELVVEQGQNNPHYRAENLKRHLQKHFGEDIVFY